MRSAYRLTSVYCEPPKPRLMTGSGFMSSASDDQRAILDEPVKTIPPGGTGCALSCCSKALMVGSQFCADTVEEYTPPKVAARASNPITGQFRHPRLMESISGLLRGQFRSNRHAQQVRRKANAGFHRVILKIRTHCVGIGQHSLHVVLIAVGFVMAAVVSVDRALLMIHVVIPAVQNQIMRDAQDGVLRVEQVNLAIAVAIHRDSKYGRLELHQANRARG